MSVKPPTEHHFEFQSLKDAAQARLGLRMSKCHNVGNLMPRLICLAILVIDNALLQFTCDICVI